MTGETRVYYGPPKTLEANGAAIANNAIGQADDASYSIAADGGNYPDAEFVLSFTFGTAPTVSRTIDLFARELNIDGTNDSEAPNTVFRPRYIGSFVVNNNTSTQYSRLMAFDVPPAADYYLLNNNTGQSITAGWTLKVTPRTYGPA